MKNFSFSGSMVALLVVFASVMALSLVSGCTTNRPVEQSGTRFNFDEADISGVERSEYAGLFGFDSKTYYARIREVVQTNDEVSLVVTLENLSRDGKEITGYKFKGHDWYVIMYTGYHPIPDGSSVSVRGMQRESLKTPWHADPDMALTEAEMDFAIDRLNKAVDIVCREGWLRYRMRWSASDKRYYEVFPRRAVTGYYAGK